MSKTWTSRTRVEAALSHEEPDRVPPGDWHVDTLRVHAQPVAVWYAVGGQKRECTWARVLSRLPGASIPVLRFGASDCRCPAHLIYFDAPPDLSPFVRAVGEAVLEEQFNI